MLCEYFGEYMLVHCELTVEYIMACNVLVSQSCFNKIRNDSIWNLNRKPIASLQSKQNSGQNGQQVVVRFKLILHYRFWEFILVGFPLHIETTSMILSALCANGHRSNLLDNVAPLFLNIVLVEVNSADPDGMPLYLTFYLNFYCLQKYWEWKWL